MADRTKLIAALNEAAARLTVEERLAQARALLQGRLVFTTSFGLEDQYLTHVIAASGLDIEITTLDTGRLFPETYALWGRTETRYGVRVKAAYPDREAIEALVARDGIEGFYQSIDKRKACCGARKVEPLGRLLSGAQGWITGLRGGQSAGRATVGFAEFDAAHDLVKLNPLFDLSRESLTSEIARLDVPYNPLHDAGFASIGCAPCTRAIAPGEPERAGRWWWEDEAQKECGLHVGPDGRLTRASAVVS